jgi:hypothetical protein
MLQQSTTIVAKIAVLIPKANKSRTIMTSPVGAHNLCPDLLVEPAPVSVFTSSALILRDSRMRLQVSRAITTGGMEKRTAKHRGLIRGSRSDGEKMYGKRPDRKQQLVACLVAGKKVEQNHHSRDTRKEEVFGQGTTDRPSGVVRPRLDARPDPRLTKRRPAKNWLHKDFHGYGKWEHHRTSWPE